MAPHKVNTQSEAKLKHILEEGLDPKINSQSECDVMNPEGKSASK